MKSTIVRSLAALFASITLSAAAFAEGPGEFQCARPACSARIIAGGQQYEFSFQRNDILDTDAGWIVNPDNGWVVN